MLHLDVRLDESIRIEVLPEVYEPSDDSYLLLKHVEVSPGESMLEMGCGCGLVALHCARAGASVTAADLSPSAVECTRKNAAMNSLRMSVVQSDLFERVPGTFDVIAFNPPYLPGETRSTSWIERSWAGGEEGSEVAAAFLAEAWKHLAPGGRTYMIFSSFGGLMSIRRAAKDRYDWEMLEEMHMFFESIYAYRLRRRSAPPEQSGQKYY